MMKVADQCWVALARLHRENPGRASFRPTEILRRVKTDAEGPVRPGIQPHISLHNLANVRPSPAQYRMFLKLPSRELRLFRPGDHAHPERKGKLRPDIADLPAEFHDLVRWYDDEYSREQSGGPAEDPVLAMLGVGQKLWAQEDGDTFIRRMRDERNWQAPEPGDTAERIWSRLLAHQGESFRTARGLVFRYVVDGNGVWFERDGARVNKRLSRKDFDKAVARLPLRKTTDISDCFDYAYLYGILTDSRIVQQSDRAA